MHNKIRHAGQFRGGVQDGNLFIQDGSNHGLATNAKTVKRNWESWEEFIDFICDHRVDTDPPAEDVLFALFPEYVDKSVFMEYITEKFASIAEGRANHEN